MNTAGKLSAYGVALALIAGGGWVVGSAVGPLSSTAAPGTEEAGHGDTHSGTVAETLEPAGLASSRNGYTFTPTTTTLPAATPTTFSFRITKGGHAVTHFDVEHEKRMHLVVVRRDTAGFQHVHPTMAADGTWSVPLTLAAPGSYRAFADFAPTDGDGMTLGVDLAVPGDFRPNVYQTSRQSTVDEYVVSLAGDLVAGKLSKVILTVSLDGKPVTDLQPYLGAYGHLVALRGGDLAYLHVHPDDEPGTGPSVTFYAEVPTAGTYRLFLDFKHGGKVRTAEFTVVGS